MGLAKFALFTFLGLLLSPVTQGQEAPKPQELSQGRWSGTLTLPGQKASLGANLDIFLAQANEAQKFPRLEGVLRLSFGGIDSSEAEVTHFSDIQYSYERGDLTFDGEASDWIVHARVVAKGQIRGTVSRSLWGGVQGELRLTYLDVAAPTEPCDSDEEECEPWVDPYQVLAKETFLLPISGSYRGTCDDGEPLQLDIIATPKAEGGEESRADFLSNFHIEEQLGAPGGCHANQESGETAFCLIRHIDFVELTLTEQTLTLMANGKEDKCKMKGIGGELSCHVWIRNKQQSCALRPLVRAISNPSRVKSSFKLKTSEHDREPLPQVNPKELKERIEGTFAGYLFHERHNYYQPMDLQIESSFSTENPHNVDDIFIAGSTHLALGPTLGSSKVSHHFDRRTFYLAKGFALRGEDSSLILSILEWKQGLIRGVVYAKDFGRVGPFELKKGQALESLPPDVKGFPNIQSNRREVKNEGSLKWEVTLRPLLNQSHQRSLVPIGGQARFVAPGMPIPSFKILGGQFDLFSSQLSLQVATDRDYSRWLWGHVRPSGSFELWSSSVSTWGTRMSKGRPVELFP